MAATPGTTVARARTRPSRRRASGHATWFIGAIGEDGFGADARATLEAEGVDVTGVVTLPGEATGVALIMVDAHGENRIAVAGGANMALTSVQVRAALKRLALTAGDIVLVGHEIRTGATHEALRLARIAGATTILNPAPATGLGRSTLDLADILTPNEGELAVLVGPEGSPSVAGRRLLGPEPGSRAALVSLGRRGAMLVAGRRARAIHAPRVDAVDTRRRRRCAQRRAGGRSGGGSRPAGGGPTGGCGRVARGDPSRRARGDAHRG